MKGSRVCVCVCVCVYVCVCECARARVCVYTPRAVVSCQGARPDCPFLQKEPPRE
jgi:hypothetical protein